MVVRPGSRPLPHHCCMHTHRLPACLPPAAVCPARRLPLAAGAAGGAGGACCGSGGGGGPPAPPGPLQQRGGGAGGGTGGHLAARRLLPAVRGGVEAPPPGVLWGGALPRWHCTGLAPRLPPPLFPSPSPSVQKTAVYKTARYIQNRQAAGSCGAKHPLRGGLNSCWRGGAPAATAGALKGWGSG